MTIPVSLLAVAVWVAIAGVAGGSLYLLIVLLREWKNRSLW